MKKFFSLLLGACTIFTACTNENEPLSADNGKCLQINVGVNQTAARSIITGTALPNESQVGISLIDESGSVYSQKNYNNVCFTCSSVEGVQKWTPLKNILLNETKGTLYAYWPYAEGTDLNAISIETTSQTDYLYGTPVPDISEKNPTANVTMNHAMSNIRLTFKDSGYQGSGILQSVSVYGKGIATTARFNAISGTYNSTGDAEKPVFDTTEKNLKDAVSNLMVIPNGVEDVINIELVVDGQTFITKSTLLTLTQGKSYNFEVQVKNTHAEISSFSVNPWVDTDFEDPLVAEKIDEFKDAILLTYFVDESSISSLEDGVNVSLINNSISDEEGLGKISGMRVDGNVITPAKTYNFTTPGYHTVEILMKDMTTIPGNLFQNCSSMVSLNIPAEVTSIGSGLLRGCSQIRNITVDKENTVLDSRDNCNAVVVTATNVLVLGCKNTVIPENVVKIGSKAFYECKDLSTVTIPESVTEYEDYAFAYTANLNTSIFNNQSVKKIGDKAFFSAKLERTITFSDVLEDVGQEILGYGTGCGTVEFGTGIKTVGSSLFGSSQGGGTIRFRGMTQPVIGGQGNAWGKTSIVIPDGAISGYTNGYSNINYGISGFSDIKEENSVTENGFLYSADKKTIIKYTGTESSLIVPEGVEHLYSSAFRNCKGLVYIQLPDGLKTIGNFAFSGSKLMGEFIIPNSVTSIGAFAFERCTGLTRFRLSENLQTIGSCAFEGCTGLTEVTIPNSVKTIEGGGFANCTGLSKVMIGSAVESIGDAWQDLTYVYGTFQGCTALTEVTMPESLVIIGTRAFYGCTLLENVTVPKNVKEIKDNAFARCSGLKSVELGLALQTIGDSAFMSCGNLESIIAKTEIAPVIKANSFAGVKSNGVLMVPTDKTDIYAYWMQNEYGYLGYHNWTIQEMTE